jgi:hypothetical protein
MERKTKNPANKGDFSAMAEMSAAIGRNTDSAA